MALGEISVNALLFHCFMFRYPIRALTPCAFSLGIPSSSRVLKRPCISETNEDKSSINRELFALFAPVHSHLI